MIDDQIDAEIEALLIATLDEMIPKAHRASARRQQIRLAEPKTTTPTAAEETFVESFDAAGFSARRDRIHTARRHRRVAVVGSMLVAAAGVAAFAVEPQAADGECRVSSIHNLLKSTGFKLFYGSVHSDMIV